MSDRDLPDGSQGDDAAAAGETAPRQSSSTQQLAQRSWFGLWAAVSAAAVGMVLDVFHTSKVEGITWLAALIVVGCAITAGLRRWDTLSRFTARTLTRLRGRPTRTANPRQRAAKSTDWTALIHTALGGIVAGLVLGALFGIAYGVGTAFVRGTGLGLLATAGAAAIIVAAAVWRGWLPDPLRGMRGWLPLTLSGVLAVAALAAGGVQGLATRPPGCPVPTELRVLASAEDIAAVQAVIPSFEQDETGAGCYTVDVTAYAAPGLSATMSAFSSWQLQVSEGFAPAPDPYAGPPPDVWIPDSVTEVPSGPVFTKLGSIGESPLVIAVPAGPVSADMQQDESWEDMYSTLAANRLGLAMPDPNSSEAGLIGVTDLYSELTSAAKERTIESAGDFPADSEALLCAAGQAAGQNINAKTAYLVSETAVAAYNAGQHGGGACAQASGRSQLAPFYPSPAAELSFQFVAVNWAHGQSPAVRAAAREFQRWLAGPGNNLLVKGGVRPLNCETGGLVLPNVYEAGDPACQNPVSPSESNMRRAQEAFNQARIPAHVLIAVDDSAPMRSYLPQITAAIDNVVGNPVPDQRDSFAIWKLPGDGSDATTLVGLELATAANREQVPSRVGMLTGHDHSHNYDVLASAAAMLYGSSQPDQAAPSLPVNSVVLLTDGDGGSKTHTASVESLFRHPQAGSTPVKLYIIAFGPSGCAQPMPQLADTTGGSCYPASQSDPLHLLQQVLDQLLGWG